MRASQLASIIAGAALCGPDIDFKSLRVDSRAVTPGDCFVAVRGSVTDGARFIPAAAQAGASLIVAENDTACPEGVSIVRVPDAKQALKQLLPALHPGAAGLKMVGVTGTNGKTSTTYLIEAILKAAGGQPGVMGTIETRYADRRISAQLTTPGPLELFATLEDMHACGVDTCVMEVSSHALDQDRPLGLSYDVALFTNLTQDHLDYHHDMDTYFAAKRRLFSDYCRGAAVINLDDLYGRQLKADFPQALGYAVEQPAEIRASAIVNSFDGIELTVTTPRGRLELKSPLRGSFHVYNIMAAVGAALAMGIPDTAIVSAIASFDNVPGRMQRVENAKGLNVFVDYAHTPDALERALANCRELTSGRLIAVFGCGGDRDRTKRPLMGAIAARLADLSFVTSDNPRTEDPHAIIEDIKPGLPAGANYVLEADRRLAIEQAVKAMQPGDCLLIAGKGHEDYQIIGTTKQPFSDFAIAAAAIEARP
ncbi:MAG: UDP-N-acetylmuramoyl-L-alanyl-D-glutamate--2,6-diaminopimelate ligase [Deltaproteobacteria bacterium ADurb.Bin510]|nr:MAG: UDP-N-acetylmuramoyl-L-alanyl-D-glutamate--2,6-diaminopimelate ligase [Deltaproteobacteria bacterium ADurb.Bin510]